MPKMDELANVLGKKELTKAPEEMEAPSLNKAKMEQFSSIEDIVDKYRDMFIRGNVEFTDMVEAMVNEMGNLTGETTEELT